MITRTPVNAKQAWQIALSNAYRDPLALLQALDLEPLQVGYHPDAHQDFRLRVPQSFVARMQKGNPQDPLLLQVLPHTAETVAHPGYSADPLQEQAANKVPGLLHKYHDRALLIVAGSCAINCRYCFRRHFSYTDNLAQHQNWQPALDYVRAHTELREVILSGGDPLLLRDQALSTLVQTIAAIPHITRLRIHSRLPIVLPERITPALTEALSHPQLSTVMVMHCNHPQELDTSVADAVQTLHQAKVSVLNQSVLLRGVNDSADILCQLSEQLFSIGVLPYYLHVLDKVQGAAHFDVPKAQAQQLIASMRHRISGYLVPRLVREDAGAKAKTLLGG